LGYHARTAGHRQTGNFGIYSNHYRCLFAGLKRIKTFVETATFLLDEQTIWLSFRVNVFAIEVFEGIILSGERIPIEIGQHNRQRFNNSLESVARDAFFEIQSIRAATFERQMKEHGFIA
jgi:hypothetical protein